MVSQENDIEPVTSDAVGDVSHAATSLERHEDMPSRSQHPTELGEGCAQSVVGQVDGRVPREGAVEGAVRVGQGGQGTDPGLELWVVLVGSTNHLRGQINPNGPAPSCYQDREHPPSATPGVQHIL